MSAVVLDLKKKFELNLKKAGIDVPILQARVAIDKSGSMESLFRSGWVDQTVDLFIGAALKFDDNGELEVGFFNHKFEVAPSATAADGGCYLLTKGKKHHADGGTAFAPIIGAFENRSEPVRKPGFFGRLLGQKAEAPEVQRAYVGIITDGANSDHVAFEKALANTSGDTFYQFIGIGAAVDRQYLQALSNRYSHVAFVQIQDPTKMTPDSFYEALCNPKFAAWV